MWHISVLSTPRCQQSYRLRRSLGVVRAGGVCHRKAISGATAMLWSQAHSGLVIKALCPMSHVSAVSWESSVMPACISSPALSFVVLNIAFEKTRVGILWKVMDVK